MNGRHAMHCAGTGMTSHLLPAGVPWVADLSRGWAAERPAGDTRPLNCSRVRSQIACSLGRSRLPVNTVLSCQMTGTPSEVTCRDVLLMSHGCVMNAWTTQCTCQR